MKQSHSCKTALCGLVVWLALSAPVLSADAHAVANNAEIRIANFTFDPPVLTVKAGTTVNWINEDDIPHLVAEKDGAFRSAALDTDEKFAQTLQVAGIVEYFCVLHPHMTGKIVVEP
jgi:plastocyanin